MDGLTVGEGEFVSVGVIVAVRVIVGVTGCWALPPLRVDKSIEPGISTKADRLINRKKQRTNSAARCFSPPRVVQCYDYAWRISSKLGCDERNVREIHQGQSKTS